MPPGKGFYGPKYRQKSSERRVAPMALLAGVPLLAFIAWIGMCQFGGGDSVTPSAGAPADGGGSNQKLVQPTELPKVAPTRDPAKKAGGANEGSAAPAVAEKPNMNEYLIAGGKRFELPLAVHAGVEEYFGAARADGKIHTGVDFSLVGLKNVPVESACDGFVVDVATDEVLGTYVTIDCGADFKVVLGWLASLRVASGNNVSKATVVGTAETDGFLHLELRYKGVPIDPKDFIQIPGKEIVPWTPTPSPTPRPGDTATPSPTNTSVPTATPRPGETPIPGGGGSNEPEPTATPSPTLGPPTATPTATSTPTITPTPTRTPTRAPTLAPRPNTPTPLPRAQ
jgi:hypothetical protein